MSAPLFPPFPKRAAGVLLHPTSLPSPLGIGNLGEGAHNFVDFLESANMHYWQVCPLGPTGYGDSPYQSFSAFAGNPYLIDLYPLVDAGLLSLKDLTALQELPEERVDFGQLYRRFWPILEKAFHNFVKKRPKLAGYGDFETFKKQQEDWLIPYAAFSTLKKHFGGKPWTAWPAEFQTFSKASHSKLLQESLEQIEFVAFSQYLFFEQWHALKKYAHTKGIQFIGDIPIFVALDSADVWAHPALFELDEQGEPTVVAGVPPDYFSKVGQLWGNPLYKWESAKKEHYRWWIQRLELNFNLFDVIRLDHFRGFDSYWAVPRSAKTAVTGKWLRGPGLDFFKAIKAALPKAQLIAEDLGDINDDVKELLKQTGLPGMAIFQFAFGGDEQNPHLPHNLITNQVIYPGTHDNDTVLGWYKNAPEHARDHCRRTFHISGEAIAWDLIRAAYAAPCALAIIPLQDILNLDSEARMNIPNEASGNWQWRFTYVQQNQAWQSAPYLKELATVHNR